MAFEDFTTYTLVDGGGTIGVTSTRATATLFVTRGASAGYVQKDKGASHFSGNFTHLLTVQITEDTGSSIFVPWLLSNLPGDIADQGSGDMLRLYFFNSAHNLHLSEVRSTVDVSDTYDLAVNTIYYLTIARVGATTTCDIYSDSGRTTLIHTMSITSAGVVDYRYVAVCTGLNNTGNSDTASGYMENLDLQESVSGPRFILGSH